MANARARHLRKHQTVAETRLWKELRKLRWQGYHFRRQTPIENYIVDFACFSQRVIIEVDGVQHATQKGQVADAARDADLTWRGFKVLRFRNDEIRDAMEGALLEILCCAGSRGEAGVERELMPLDDPPTPSPSPRGGGGPVGVLGKVGAPEGAHQSAGRPC